MSVRRQSREYAVELLYQMFMQGQKQDCFLDVFSNYWDLKAKKLLLSKSFPEIKEFTATLVDGVFRHVDSIDGVISAHLDRSHIDKIGAIDRNILRLALFEMFHLDTIPCQVSIDEAIEIAKKYGSNESYHFVNALLDSVYNQVLKK